MLNVGGQRVTRRCRACWFTKTEHLPRLNKRVIYIDQFGLSEMMKVTDPSMPSHGRAAEHPLWKALFQKLHRLTLCQLIACPTSTLHTEETLMFRFGRELESLSRMLDGGVTLHSPSEVIHAQLIHHVEHWLKDSPTDYQSLIHPRDAVRGGVEDWGDKISIYCDSFWSEEFISRLRELREETSEAMTAVFDLWRTEGLSFREFYQREVRTWGETVWEQFFLGLKKQWEWTSGSRPMVPDDLNFSPSTEIVGMLRTGLEGCGVPDAELLKKIGDYLHSDRLGELPFLHISAVLYATEARRAVLGKRKPPTRGFLADVRMISTYLPYCDAMFVDNSCASYLNEVRKQIPFATPVFSAHTGAEFLRFLDTVEADASKEHFRRVRSIYGPDWGKPAETIQWARIAAEPWQQDRPVTGEQADETAASAGTVE